ADLLELVSRIRARATAVGPVGLTATCAGFGLMEGYHRQLLGDARIPQPHGFTDLAHVMDPPIDECRWVHRSTIHRNVSMDPLESAHGVEGAAGPPAARCL